MSLSLHITNIIFSSKIASLIPGYIRKKLLKEKNICFVPTNLHKLSVNNHPIFSSVERQKEIINQFSETKEEITYKTYPNLIKLLKTKFKKDSDFNFLDFGGDQIDQYLILKKEFVNVKYFFINQKEINQHFMEIKSHYNYKDSFILNDLNELLDVEYDFINFGSVLQYIVNYKELLNKILSKSNSYVLISAIHFYKSGIKKNSQIVKQVNLLPNKLYLYFFYFYDFLKIFENHSFTVEFINENKTHKINYENFDIFGISELKYTDILFKKTKLKY